MAITGYQPPEARTISKAGLLAMRETVRGSALLMASTSPDMRAFMRGAVSLMTVKVTLSR